MNAASSFHLAAAVGVQLVVESPVRTLHTNVRAAELVLEAAKKEKENGIDYLDVRSVWQSDEDPFPGG